MKPTHILFICHGNICRSTMAQSVMQHIVNEAGRTDKFIIDSAAVSDEELGNPVYPCTVDQLKLEGVPVVKHRARKISRAEAPDWDYIICMDESNIRFIRNMIDKRDMQRVWKLMDFAKIGKALDEGKHVGNDDDFRCMSADVADPWYTRNFQRTFDDVYVACTGLLNYLTSVR